MKLLARISKLITANINSLLDEAEDPEVMVKQLIRDIEESIVELRRETVKAVANEKQLEKQLSSTVDLIIDLESKARLALEKDEEALAREVLKKKLRTEKTRDNLTKEHKSSVNLSAQLKSDLVRLEDRAQEVRRKKEELIRRKLSAEAALRTQKAAKKSSEIVSDVKSFIDDIERSITDVDSIENEIIKIESQAEAEKEVLELEIKKELDLQSLAEENSVNEELDRLKKDLNKTN